MTEAPNTATTTRQVWFLTIDEEGTPARTWGDAQRVCEAIGHVLIPVEYLGEGDWVCDVEDDVADVATENDWHELEGGPFGAEYNPDSISPTAHNDHQGCDPDVCPWLRDLAITLEDEGVHGIAALIAGIVKTHQAALDTARRHQA